MYNVRIAHLLYAGTESEEQKRETSRRFYNMSLVATHALDITSAFTLLIATCGAPENTFACIKQELFGPEGYSFASGAGICVAFACLRLVIFQLLSKLAIKLGSESFHSIVDDADKGKSKASSLEEPLLDESVSDSTGSGSEKEDFNQLRLKIHEAETTGEGEGTKFNRNNAYKSAQTFKYFFMTLIFLTSCGFQIYSGIKVSSFEWTHERGLEIFSMSISVLWINILAYLYRSQVDDFTQEEGLYLPHVHKHPLFWTRGLLMHDCDLCREKIKNKVGGAFRCRLCDFDCCVKCAKRDDIGNVGENLIRTDKGVQEQSKVSNTAFLLRAFEIATPEAPLLFISLLCLLLSTVVSLVLPSLQGSIINKLIATDREEFLANISTYLFFMIFQGFMTGVSSFLFTLIGRKLTFHVRNKLFKSVIRQDVAFFDGTTSGHLTSKLTNDILYMMYPIRSLLSSVLTGSITLLGGIVMCYYTSYKLSLLAFVTVGPIMYLWELYGEFSKRLQRKMLVAYGQSNSIATEALNHIRDVKAFCNEEEELKQYEDSNRVALNAGIKDAVGNGVTQMITGYLDLGTGVLIMWFGGILVLKNSLTVGELVAFQFYWNMMNSAYQNLQGLMVQFTQAAAAAEKVFTLWDTTPDISDSDGKEIDWEVKGDLQLENVSFFYQMRPDNIVLSNINLKVDAGTVCALVGRSGGGKSTIIRLFQRFYDPREGKLFLDGREYCSLQVGSLRRHFGSVSQNTSLFAKSILYNITYGLNPDDYTMDDVVAACKKAQCYDFIMSLKDKFDTRAGEAGVRVSGGQGQRIAIARIFLRKPKIILLDEATSALDEESQSLVQASLDTLLEERAATIVLVAHRLSTVRYADKIAVIDKGRVLEEGSHEELVKIDGGVYQKLVNLKNKNDASISSDSNKISGKKPQAENVEEIMEEIFKERENEEK